MNVHLCLSSTTGGGPGEDGGRKLQLHLSPAAERRRIVRKSEHARLTDAAWQRGPIVKLRCDTSFIICRKSDPDPSTPQPC